MFCPKCGKNIEEDICPYCHTNIEDYKTENNDNIKENTDNINNFAENEYGEPFRKSRIMAGILQIFLGAFGIGRFYLGYYKTAIWQIVLSLVTLFIGGAVWGFIDGILILNGNPHTDAFGKALGN